MPFDPGTAVGATVAILLLLVQIPGVPIDALADSPRPNEWIVTFAGPPDEAARDDLEAIVDSAHYYSSIPAAFVEAPDAGRADLEALPSVVRVDPNDALEPHLDRTRAFLRIEKGLQAAPPMQPVSIAVIDSGVDTAHPGLTDRVRRTVTVTAGAMEPGTYDERGHGTAVASVAAGTGGGSPDSLYAGVDPTASLVVIDLGDRWTLDGAVRAVDWLVEHAEAENVGVVLASLGRTAPTTSFDPGDPLVRALDSLVAADLVVVTSAGNRGPGQATMSNEALNPNILAVGAVDLTGRPAEFSSRGPAGSSKPDVYAPGVDVIAGAASAFAPGVMSDTPRNHAPHYYAIADGTSLAAAHVAGIVAAHRAAFPSETAAQVTQHLRARAAVTPAEPDVRIADAYFLALGASAGRGDSTTVVLEWSWRPQGGTTHLEEPIPVPVWSTGGSVTASWLNADWRLRSPGHGSTSSTVTGDTARFTLPASPEAGQWHLIADARDVKPPEHLLEVTFRSFEERRVASAVASPPQPVDATEEAETVQSPSMAFAVSLAAVAVASMWIARRRD